MGYVPDLGRHSPRALRGSYVRVGQAFSWATLALAWLMAFAIGSRNRCRQRGAFM
jgi:hypothetical protein